MLCSPHAFWVEKGWFCVCLFVFSPLTLLAADVIHAEVHLVRKEQGTHRGRQKHAVPVGDALSALCSAEQHGGRLGGSVPIGGSRQGARDHGRADTSHRPSANLLRGQCRQRDGSRVAGDACPVRPRAAACLTRSLAATRAAGAALASSCLIHCVRHWGRCSPAPP